MFVWLATKPLPYVLIAGSMLFTARQVWRMEPDRLDAIEAVATFAIFPTCVVLTAASSPRPWQYAPRRVVAGLLGVLMVVYGWWCADFYTGTGNRLAAGLAWAFIASLAPMLTSTLCVANAAQHQPPDRTDGQPRG